MTAALVLLGTVGLLTFYAFVWALCRAAGNADRAISQARHPAKKDPD